jgi:hypothetical protein
MEAMKRPVAILLVVVLVAGVLLDPYTFHSTASDFVQPAPWWQLTLGLTDAALLVLVGVLLWRRLPRTAFWVAGTEALYALALGIGFVERDGIARFVAGFGAEEYLTMYLGTIASRVLVLMFVQALASEVREAVP